MSSEDDDNLLGGLLDEVSSEEEQENVRTKTTTSTKDDKNKESFFKTTTNQQQQQPDPLKHVQSRMKQLRKKEEQQQLRKKTSSPAFGVTKPLPRTQWPKGKTDVERFSKLKIKNRKVSAEEMERNMAGRTFFAMGTLKHHRKTLCNEESALDWVTIGVLAEKSKPRLTKSSKGGAPRKFSTWTLDDLNGTSVTLFLHRLAYESHWDVPIGSVVALVSPQCLASRTGFDDKRFAISVNESERVVILGQSKDYARCKATRKDGTIVFLYHSHISLYHSFSHTHIYFTYSTTGKPCTKAVNATQCGYCEYHIAFKFKMAKSKRGFSSGASARPSQKQVVPTKRSSVHLSQNGVFTMGGKSNRRNAVSFRVERQGQVRVLFCSRVTHNTYSHIITYTIRYVFKPPELKDF